VNGVPLSIIRVDILVFGPDFGSAVLETGVVKFTVAEARLLKFLSAYPGHTLSRGQIIDAIYEDGAAKNDRSVDFLINRVRRKLGDDPRAPRFIETRYGGGYVWCGPAGRDAPAVISDAVAVVGPLSGLDLLGTGRDLGQAFAKALADALDSQIAGAALLDTRPADQGAREYGKTRMQIELSYFRRGEDLECIVTGKSRRSGQIFLLHRQQLIRESAPFSANARAADALVAEILTARWRKDLDHIANSEPVALAMHNAALEDQDNRISVGELDGILARLRAERPEDPEVAMLQASNLHSQVIAKAGETFIDGLEACRKIDTEIERLVQGALSWCQDKPDKAMLAAKLLYYVEPGYKPLAKELAEKAHRESTAIASSLAIFGQLKNYFGETEETTDHALHKRIAVLEDEEFVDVVQQPADFVGRDRVLPDRQDRVVWVGDVLAVVVVGQPTGDDALLAVENQLVVAAGLGPFQQLGLFLGEMLVLDPCVGG